MKKELKKKWIKNLLSGEFVQTAHTLCRLDSRNRASYCCLGVLIETVRGEDAWVEPDNKYPDGSCSLLVRGNKYNDLLGTELPSKNFLKEVGLSLSDAHDLAALNDEGKTFKTIAKIIEEEID